MVSVASRVGCLAVALLAALMCPLGAADSGPRCELLKLNEITGNDVIDAKIGALVKDRVATKKLLALAGAMAKEKDPPFTYNALHILASAAHKLKDVDVAEQFYRLGIDEAVKLVSGQKMVQSIGGLIDLFYENEKYDEAASLCREFLAIQGNETIDRLKPIAVERLIESLAKQDKMDQAMKLVNGLVKAESKHDGWWFLRLMGRLQHEAEQFDEAATTYENVLERIGKDKHLDEREKDGFIQEVRSALSEVYTELNQVDKATEQLKALLKEKPDDPRYNNDLGYLWADHDMNLAEAEKLIRKAIEEDRKLRQAEPDWVAEEDKDEPAYLDSLGWVLFKRKKYEEAKKYLLRAVQGAEEPDVETLGHLGQAYEALGEIADAKKAYRDAIEAAGPRKHDQDRKASIEIKQKALDN